MKTSEILDTAADKIEELGWVKGSSGWGIRDGKGLCLEGGILAAMGVNWMEAPYNDDTGVFEYMECPAYTAVMDYLGYSLEDEDRLWQFNDDSSKEQVIETLRAVAVIEAAREEALVTA